MSRMGVLGALRGVGTGIVQNSQFAREQEAADLDEQRQARLQKIRDDAAMQRTTVTQEGANQRAELAAETSTANAQLAADTSITTTEMSTTAADERNIDSLASSEYIAQEQIASRERIAAMSAAAAAATARLDAIKDRFQARTLKKGEPVPGYPGLTNEEDTPAIFDQQSGLHFVQQGSRFELPGFDFETGPRFKNDQARTAALQALYENPEEYPAFARTFGFLPADFFYAAGVSPRGQ
jgi:hypothetical protein